MTLLLAAALIVVNGLFVAMEFSLLSSLRSRIEVEAETGRLRGRVALRSMGNLGPFLAGCQLGVTAASLALGSVAEPAAAHLLERLFGVVDMPKGAAHSIALILGLGVVVFVHLVGGEMVPKNVALAQPERTLLALALPTTAFVAVFKPVIWVLNRLAALGARAFGVRTAVELRSAATSAQLGVMLEESREEGLLADSDHDLLAGALGFLDRRAEEVMVPRDRMVSVPRSATVADIEQAVRSSGHSRLLVSGRGPDDILGFIHAKDLLRIPTADRHRPFPARMYRHTINIPPGRSLDDVLVAMRGARRHLAVVVSPDRRTLGMLTLEDVLESIVGDIVDESDLREP